MKFKFLVPLVLSLIFTWSWSSGWGQYTVNFGGAGETKTGYASGNVTLSGIQWNMTEALIGTEPGELIEGSRTARGRGYGTSSLTMNADKSNGIGTISFKYRRYSTDTQVAWMVEYSTNGGTDWFQAGSNFTPDGTLRDFSASVNVTGNARIRIRTVSSTGTSNRRANFDIIALTDYVAATPTLNAVTLGSALSSTYGTASAGVGFAVGGSNLTTTITVTPQSGYEIATSSGGPYQSTAMTGITNGTTLWVRFPSTRAAGTYDSATAVVLSGGGTSSNANVTTSSSGNTVAQKALTITAATIASKVYNGSTASGAVTAGTLSGFVGTETVVVSSATGVYADANVGTGKTATISYSLGNGTNGGLAANYSLANTSATGNITAKALTVTANNVTKEIGATLTSGSGSTAFTSSGLISGQTIGSVTITYGTGAAAGDPIGTYTNQVTPAAASGGTFSASNYSITYVAGSIAVQNTTSVLLTGLGITATEDFNTLANSGTSSALPTGWYFSESGTNTNTTYTAGTGSSSTGDSYSFGSGTERALGGLLSGSLVPVIGGKFLNNTGSTINNLFISYTGETWRVGTANRIDRLDFQYSLNATSLTTGTWTDFDALDYANPGQATGSGSMQHSSFISDVITDLSIANGASFWIRWTDFNASGADDGMAVDDFSIKPCGTVSPPTASAQSFCSTAFATVASLVATGTAIQWYSASTGGTALATSTALTTGTYYASQTLGGCESTTRTSVAVTITNNPAAPTASPQNFCTVLSPVQVSDLTATGTAIQWYSAVTGGAALAIGTALTTGTYYASQTLSGCESMTRTSVAVSLSNIIPSITPTAGDLIWNGRTNTDFGTSSNWFEYDGTTYINSSAAPSSLTNIIIPASESICVLQQPTLTTGFNVKNLTVESGASLTLQSSTLSVAGNWENNGTFTTGTGTVAFNGTSDQIISNAAGETFTNLTINKASGLVLLFNDVTISNQLNLTNGILDLQASNLNMASNPINGGSASSYVRTSGNGVLKRNVSSSPTLFPVGKSAYNPAILTNSGEADLFSVRVYDYVSATGVEGGIQTSGQAVNRTWMISESVASGSDVTLTMYWNAGEELNGFVYSPGFMNVMHHNGSIWEELGATDQGDSPYFIKKSGISSFSPFTIGFTGSPLPVEFLEFTAKCNESSETVLNWSTASEHNSDYFKIEKSIDGMNWSILETVAAAGNSTERIDYTLVDNEKSSAAYYKLWQYDVDGSESFLALVHDDCSGNFSDAQPVVYPNPTTNNALTIQFNDDKADLVKVQIYSLQGKLMYSQTFKGAQKITIADLTLDKGIYQMTIQQDGKDATNSKICIQ